MNSTPWNPRGLVSLSAFGSTAFRSIPSGSFWRLADAFVEGNESAGPLEAPASGRTLKSSRIKDSPVNGKSANVGPAMSDRRGEREAFLVSSSPDRRSENRSTPPLGEQFFIAAAAVPQSGQRATDCGGHQSEWMSITGISSGDAWKISPSSCASVGGPRAGASGGGWSGSPRCVRILRTGLGSVMNAMSRMSSPYAKIDIFIPVYGSGDHGWSAVGNKC